MTDPRPVAVLGLDRIALGIAAAIVGVQGTKRGNPNLTDIAERLNAAADQLATPEPEGEEQ